MQPTSGDSFVAAVTGPKGDPGDVSAAQLNAAIAALKNGVDPAGDTLAELYALILLRATLNQVAAFTASPTVPTLAPGNNSTKVTNSAYVRQELVNYALALTGGTLSGPLILAADPVAALGAVTKQYVDAFIQGISNKYSALCATTTTLPANTYSNGLGTLTATANGALTVDGQSPTAGVFVLVKNEAAGANNGLYQVTQAGDGSHPYILTRALDDDTAAEMAGAFCFVELGTVNNKTGWLCGQSAITIGTTAIVFTQFSGAGTYTAGTGLTLTGSQFSIDGAIVGRLATANIWALAQTFTVAPVFTDAPGSRTAIGLGNADNTSDATKNAAAVTLANKTLTTPVINGLPTGTGVATANTASTLVARDASGNFAAGAVTVTGLNDSGLTASCAVATDGSKNLVSVTNTGTGNNVLATNPVLTTPNLGTPSAAVLTNATGTASGLTAGSVTTNANLTGPITSVGNATSIASQTGTGSKFVVDTSPILVTPNIGAASATSLAITGVITSTLNDNTNTFGGNFSNSNTGNAALCGVVFLNSAGTLISFQQNGISKSYGASANGDSMIRSNATGLVLMADNASGRIKLAAGGSAENASLFPSGGLSVSGTPTDPGAGGIFAGGGITCSGAFATRKGSVAVANGLNSNIATPSNSIIRLTGPTAAFQVGGFTGGVDGYRLAVYNTVAQAMTIKNEDASSTAGNRLKTLTGADVTLRAGTSFAEFEYDGTDSRWVLIATN